MLRTLFLLFVGKFQKHQWVDVSVAKFDYLGTKMRFGYVRVTRGLQLVIDLLCYHGSVQWCYRANPVGFFSGVLMRTEKKKIEIKSSEMAGNAYKIQ